MRPVIRTKTGAMTSTSTTPQRLLEEAVLREAPALLAYLTRRVSDPADAGDLLGDVLLVVWRRTDSMPPEPGPARMWMFGVARKTLAGSHRTLRRRRALTARLRHEITTADTTVNLTGEATRTAADPRTVRMTSAMSQLSPADRQIITLIHWDSFTMTEAAEHLRLRLSTTRSRYHRARTRLKRLLETDQGDSRHHRRVGHLAPPGGVVRATSLPGRTCDAT